MSEDSDDLHKAKLEVQDVAVKNWEDLAWDICDYLAEDRNFGEYDRTEICVLVELAVRKRAKESQ